MFFKKDAVPEKGQVLVLLALGIIGLLALAGLAIDGGNVFSDRRNAQNAVDNASAAASLAWIKGENYQTAGDFILNQNSYTNGNGAWTYDATPITCSNGAEGIVILVTMNTTVDTYFASIVGWNQLHNKVLAQTRACKVGAPKPLYTGNSVFSTKKEDCGVGYNKAGLGNSGSAIVNFYGGGMGQASDDPTCTNIKGGETNLYENTAGDCGTISTAADSMFKLNGVDFTCGSAPVYNSLYDDPPEDLGITCDTDAVVTDNTMSPGNWPGDFPPDDVDTLEPGTYCIGGDFSLSNGQTLTGDGVTIVMNDGEINWRGGSTAQLTAPGNGTYKGLLIYAPPTNPDASLALNGTADIFLQGTVLAQTAPCDILGDSTENPNEKLPLQLICYTVQFNGNNTSNFVYDSDLLYTPQEPPSVELLR